MTGPMRGFFRLSVGYFFVMLVVIWLFRDQPVLLLKNMLATPLFHLSLLVRFLPWLIGLLMLAFYLNRHRPRGDLLKSLAFSLAGTIIFSFTFAAMKTTMPSIWPYFADPTLARIDKAMHFGHAPWSLVHRLGWLIPPQLPQFVYYDLWLVPAIFFPVFLVLLDTDPRRAARFLALYVFVWIGLGNIVALAGLSVGPVYYDRLLGSDQFAGFMAVLKDSGLAGASIGRLQDIMWSYLQTNNQMEGAGISAFPSVHIGVAAVIAAYAFERSRLLGAIFGIYLLILLFLSVYLGWHYAIDGYFSIIAVALFWRLKISLPFPKS